MEKEHKKISFRGKLATGFMRKAIHRLTINGFLKLGVAYCKFTKWNVPEGYQLQKIDLEGLPVEILTKDQGRHDKVILQLHGGAYVMGYNNVYRNVALRYSKIANGANVVSIDYRVAPAHTFPAALEDSEKAWNYLLAQGYKPNDIIIVGDSAGGNLTVALVAKLRDEGRPLPKAIICLSPWLDMSRSGKSYQYNLFQDAMFGLEKKDTEYRVNDVDLLLAYAGETQLDHKYLSPIFGEFHNFPPIHIQVGTNEVLASDSMTLYEKATAAGVQVEIVRYPTIFHDFQVFFNFSEEVKVAWDHIKAFLDKYLV